MNEPIPIRTVIKMKQIRFCRKREMNTGKREWLHIAGYPWMKKISSTAWIRKFKYYSGKPYRRRRAISEADEGLWKGEDRLYHHELDKPLCKKHRWQLKLDQKRGRYLFWRAKSWFLKAENEMLIGFFSVMAQSESESVSTNSVMIPDEAEIMKAVFRMFHRV